jgi:transposase InsO family protein
VVRIAVEGGEQGLSDRSSEQPVRYERSRPGELVRIDVKLGRIEGGAKRAFQSQRRQQHRPRRNDRDGVRRCSVGFECVHVCLDDDSRLAYAQVLANEKAVTAVGFLRRTVAFYRRHGITIERVLTDNGSAYMSAVYALACRSLGIRHSHTRPYRPQTNGKAERFIRTLLTGWAYGAVYGSSQERTLALAG